MSITLKRFMTGTVVVSLAALALVGCTSQPKASDSSTSAKLDTLTIQAPYLSAEPPAADNPIGQQLNKLLGTNV